MGREGRRASISHELRRSVAAQRQHVDLLALRLFHSSRAAELGYLLKLFFGLFVATAIAFLALFIRPVDLDLRFGLGGGAF